jgi:hypothetical protein
MRVSRWGVLVCALLSLGGCQTLAERQAARQAALRQHDDERCLSYGFNPGTNAFANCMMKRDALREEEAAIRRVIHRERACQNASNSGGRGFAGGFLAGVNQGLACN